MAKRSASTTSRAGKAAAQAQAEARLVQHCAERKLRLTPMRRAVFRQLQSETKPQTAYQILESVQAALGRKIAPLQVYRALDFLAQEGWLHRLESTRAFTPCRTPEHAHTGVLLLCQDCGRAEEAEDEQLDALLDRDARRRGFRSQRRVVEILGVCRECDA